MNNKMVKGQQICSIKKQYLSLEKIESKLQNHEYENIFSVLI